MFSLSLYATTHNLYGHTFMTLLHSKISSQYATISLLSLLCHAQSQLWMRTSFWSCTTSWRPRRGFKPRTSTSSPWSPWSGLNPARMSANGRANGATRNTRQPRNWCVLELLYIGIVRFVLLIERCSVSWWSLSVKKQLQAKKYK